MSFDVGGKSGLKAEINITPLVDVVLVLLIIFMVMSPTVVQQLAVQVPDKAESQEPEDTQDQLVLTVLAGGVIELNGEAGSLQDLGPRLSSALAPRSTKVVFFAARDDATYADVIDALDVARASGAKILAAVTQ